MPRAWFNGPERLCRSRVPWRAAAASRGELRSHRLPVIFPYSHSQMPFLLIHEQFPSPPSLFLDLAPSTAPPESDALSTARAPRRPRRRFVPCRGLSVLLPVNLQRHACLLYPLTFRSPAFVVHLISRVKNPLSAPLLGPRPPFRSVPCCQLPLRVFKLLLMTTGTMLLSRCSFSVNPVPPSVGQIVSVAGHARAPESLAPFFHGVIPVPRSAQRAGPAQHTDRACRVRLRLRSTLNWLPVPFRADPQSLRTASSFGRLPPVLDVFFLPYKGGLGSHKAV